MRRKVKSTIRSAIYSCRVPPCAQHTTLIVTKDVLRPSRALGRASGVRSVPPSAGLRRTASRFKFPGAAARGGGADGWREGLF